MLVVLNLMKHVFYYIISGDKFSFIRGYQLVTILEQFIFEIMYLIAFAKEFLVEEI